VTVCFLQECSRTVLQYRPDGDALQASSSGGHGKIVEMFIEDQYTYDCRLWDYSDLFMARISE
jgi:hypothetical protein